jgi:hypothetical protein
MMATHWQKKEHANRNVYTRLQPTHQHSEFWYGKCSECKAVSVHFINIPLACLYKIIYLLIACINY